MKRILLLAALVVAATALTAPGTAGIKRPATGSATPAEKQYGTFLKPHYLPYYKATASAVKFCNRGNLAPTRCRAALTASERAGASLLTALGRATVPASLSRAHRQLTSSVRAVDAWFKKFVAALDSGKKAAIDKFCICGVPSNNVLTAISEIGVVSGVNLPLPKF